MITIKIKTPVDYWKQLVEYIKSPRQKHCKAIVDYYHYLIYSELEEHANDYFQDLDHNTRQVAIACMNRLNNSVLNRVDDYIEENYPKYNI